MFSNGPSKANMTQDSSTNNNDAAADQQAQMYAKPNARHYKVISTIEQIIDEQEVIVEETLLVSSRTSFPMNFSLRITELRNVDTVYATIREAELLKIFGLHNNIMGLLSVFRHRQYVAFVFPNFTSVRDRLDVRYRFKHSDNDVSEIVVHEAGAPSWSKDLTHRHRKMLKNEPGILNRNSVAYVLKEVLKAVRYIHSKGYVHTQIASSNVFINNAVNVKLGGFLHCRKIGSEKWNFTGNPSRHPPEAFLQYRIDGNNRQVEPSFDVWAIGMFTLELITGLGARHSPKRMELMAMELINGDRLPPTLAEIDSSTVSNDKQIYDQDIDSFVEACLEINPSNRSSLSDLCSHPFVSRSINLADAKRNWQTYSMEQIKWNTERSLHTEMLSVQCESSELDPDFLLSLNKAIRLAEKEFYPIIDKVSDVELFKEYVAIEAQLAVQQQDEDWSQDVLDVSRTSSQDFLDDYRNQNMSLRRRSRTPKNKGGRLSGDHYSRNNKLFVSEKFQRNEMIFFVGKKWSADSRQLFVALQFARWYLRNLLSFSDLVRIVDEIENVLKEHMCSVSDSAPGSISFVSGLRKSHQDATSEIGSEARRFNHICVEIGLRSKIMAIMKKKFDKLEEGDPASLSPRKTTLQAAATYRELDTKRLEMLESVMLGKQRVNEWEYLPEQRFEDATDKHTEIRYLLQERRRNPIHKHTSYNDPEASNQARMAKIWGDYDRDFMFRFCKFAVPYKLNEEGARTLYGDINGKSMEEQLRASQQLVPYNELERQLLRTRSKQEEDVLYPYKVHDDVEARKDAVAKLIKVGQNHENRLNRLESLMYQMQQSSKGFDQSGYLSPAPNPTIKLRRLPQRNNRK